MALLKRMEAELQTIWHKVQLEKDRIQRDLALKDYKIKLDAYLRHKQLVEVMQN